MERCRHSERRELSLPEAWWNYVLPLPGRHRRTGDRSKNWSGMINEIKIMHSETQLNLQSFQIKQRMLERSYDDLHNRLKALYKPLEQLEERLTILPKKPSAEASKVFWNRYWTATVVGIISALYCGRGPQNSYLGHQIPRLQRSVSRVVLFTNTKNTDVPATFSQSVS